METEALEAFSSRRMFGGVGYFIHGRMFAGWYGDDTVALKLPPDARAELLQTAPGQEQRGQYIPVPPHFLDDAALLTPWVQRSVAYVRSLPAKKKRRV